MSIYICVTLSSPGIQPLEVEEYKYVPDYFGFFRPQIFFEMETSQMYDNNNN